jgi:Flp pilus assembly protein TadD
MRLYKLIPAYRSLPMGYCLLLTASCLLVTAYCFLVPTPVSAQQIELSITPEALRLPEVVITGIDRTKIQRMFPKVPQSPPPVVKQSSLDLSESLVQEGDVLFLNRAGQGAEQYAKAIDLDPTNSTAYLRLGDVYRSLDKYVDAAETYQKALATSADNLEAHYKLGILYESQLQDLQQAIAHYRAYLRLGGSDTRVRIWLRDAERQ